MLNGQRERGDGSPPTPEAVLGLFVGMNRLVVVRPVKVRRTARVGVGRRRRAEFKLLSVNVGGCCLDRSSTCQLSLSR